MPSLHFSKGLWSGVGGATPEHAYDALNVFEFGASTVGRDGAEPLEVINPTSETAYWGTSDSATTEPSSVTNGASALAAGQKVLFIGGSAPWNMAAINGDIGPLVGDADRLDFPSFFSVYYWNGSAYVLERGPARLWQNFTVDAGADYSFFNWPLSFVDDGGLGAFPDDGVQRPLFANPPPSDWASKSIGGQTKYWRMLVGWPAAWTAAITSFNLVKVQLKTRRVVHLNAFNTRLGGPNLFKVTVDEDGKALHFYLNGTEMTQGGGLTPDGSSVEFDANTDVWSTYVPAINKVIGRVLGWNWFVFVPGSPTNLIDVLTPTGADTIYNSLDQGLRTAFQPGKVAFFFDGRVFTGDGNQLTWTAPDAYPDVAPNEFERFLQDGGGVLTCGVAAKTYAALFTQSAVYRVISDGTSDGYLAEKLVGGVGALGPRCAVAVGDTVFFRSVDGIYQLLGSGEVNKVSTAINSFIRDPNMANRSRDTLVYHAGYNQLRLFYTSSESPLAYDSALYGGAAPVQWQGSNGNEIAWWPQGKKNPTDYGFNGCCVVMDERTPQPVMLIGDPYGVVWQHDVGQSDCGPPVTRRLMSAPLNLDTSQETVVRWVNVALKNTGDVTLDVMCVADINEEKTDTQTQDVYVDANERVADSTTVVDSTSTVHGDDDSTMMECSFETRCRVVQVGIEQEEELPLELTAIEVRANAQGRVGAR